MKKIIFDLRLQTIITVLISLIITTPILAQTCNDEIPATSKDSRYQNHGDGTITDTKTELMWKRCSEGQTGEQCDAGYVTNFTWRESLNYIENANITGGFSSYSDWRLPNRKELESLVEEACYSPAINMNIFPNTPNLFYWSSSRYPASTIYVWGVNFEAGDSYPSFDIGLPIRLVRGG